MNEGLQLFLYGFGFMIFGGGGIYLFLLTAERICQWLAEQSKPDEPK